MHINFTVFMHTVRMVYGPSYKDFIPSHNNFAAILFYMSQKCHNDLFMAISSFTFSLKLENILLGRDLMRVLVQPPAQLGSAQGLDEVTQGFIQACLEIF